MMNKPTDKLDGNKRRLTKERRRLPSKTITPEQRARRLGVLFEQWEAEDALMTPEEIEAATARWKEVERGLAEHPVNIGPADA